MDGPAVVLAHAGQVHGEAAGEADVDGFLRVKGRAAFGALGSNRRMFARAVVLGAASGVNTRPAESTNVDLLSRFDGLATLRTWRPRGRVLPLESMGFPTT